jgi:DNA-binding MarR family transcriptional regulator
MAARAVRRATSSEPPASARADKERATAKPGFAREGKERASARQASERTTSRDPQVANFDRIIHERLRLGIISALAVNDRLTFNDLKRLLDTTDGNLSVHARKLEDAQYIVVEKSFAGRLPRTEYRVTAAGRRALEKYLAHLEALIKAVRD